jgi:quinol monooxygenase YgiN
MIIVTGTVTCDPAHAREYAESGRAVSEVTRGEPGCISHHMLLENEALGRLVVTERWQDEEALRAHMRTPHVAEFSRRYGGLVTGSDVMLYDAGEARSLMTLF